MILQEKGFVSILTFKKIQWPVFNRSCGIDIGYHTVVNSNMHNKYLTGSKLIRFVSQLHMASLIRLIAALKGHAPLTVASIGCGDSYVNAAILLNCKNVKAITGLDIDRDSLKLSSIVYNQNNLGQTLVQGSIYSLPFETGEFDLVICSEVIEHLDNPSVALLELRRIAKKYCLLSVPNDFIFRSSNLVRLYYLRDLGNTPGHIQHFGILSFVGFVKKYFRVLSVQLPACLWIVVLAQKDCM
jgi:ubiquinone/menaquinone biosynthesis C-methylase UbiE